MIMLPISILACAILNRIIGMAPEDFPSLMRRFYSYRRPFAYMSTGLLGMFLNYFYKVDLSISGVLLSFIIPAVGYIIFRQPGPDSVFFAVTGRPATEEPNNKLVRFCLRKFHNTSTSIVTSARTPAKELVRYGVLAGVYRGLMAVPFALGMLYFSQPFTLALLPLGALMGVIYYFSGAYSPIKAFRTEVRAIERAELLTGAIIVGLTLTLPFILGAGHDGVLQ